MGSASGVVTVHVEGGARVWSLHVCCGVTFSTVDQKHRVTEGSKSK